MGVVAARSLMCA